MGRAVKPMDPVYPAEMGAEAIVELAEEPERERFSGNAGRMLAAFHAVAPALYERLIPQAVERNHFQAEPRRRPPATCSSRSRGIAG